MSSYSTTSKIVVSNDGTKLYAEALGNPSLPAIVFIHGFALSFICFDIIFSDQNWTEQAYLIRYDMRGHGASDRPLDPEAYESGKEAEDFLAVIKAFGVENAFLAGWSMGATVAVDLCAYPGVGSSVLHGIISLSGLPYVPIISKIVSPFVLGLLPGLTTTDDVALCMTTGKDFLDSLVYRPEKLPYRTRAAWLGDVMSVPPAIRTIVLTRVQDPAPFLERALPTLFLQGSEDRQRLAAQVLVDELKPSFGEKLEVKIFENVGHALFMEVPEEVRDATLEFVARVKREKL